MGIFVPVMAVVMCVILYLSLLLMQGVKFVLGISDDFAEEEEVWQSADQLFHFAGDNADHQSTNWIRHEWPGVNAGRGSLNEQRWRNGRTAQ